MTITPEQKDAIHSALEKSGGNISHAAKAMGTTFNKLLNTIHASPELRVRWTDSSKSDTPTFRRSQERSLSLENTSRRAEEEFEKSLAEVGLGLTGKEAQSALAYQKFHNKQFAQCVDMISGLVAVNAMRLNSFCDKQLAKLETGFSGDPEEQIERERLAVNAYLEGSELLRKYGSDAQKNAMLRAVVEQRRGGGSKMKRGKPGFTPLEQPARDVRVLAQAGSTVILEGDPQA